MQIENQNEVVSLNTFARSIPITPVTAWRWRNAGWITTINIAGRQYVTRSEIARFKTRAEAGEFARKHQVPFKKAMA